MDRPRSPPAHPPTPDHRSSTPPAHYKQPQHHVHVHDHDQLLPRQSRPDSRLADSRLLPPPPARNPASGSSAVDKDATPPGSPPHKRFKPENALPPPIPCAVDQRWHYSHGPYPPSFYPYPYHHQNMPHRVEDMSIDRSISHRSDGQAQYQFMPPHSHPTPPPIATLHHSPALSASSLDSNSISPSPPITQPSTPYYSHPGQAPPMSQAPPYPYQPNGSIARYADDQSAQGYPIPPHSAQSLSRSIRPTMVATQPYPGQANYIIHTDDASTKLSDRVRRKCYNCRTTDTSTWRRSSLTPGKVLCNKCGLFERTHSRPRPEQFPHKRGPVNVNQFKQHRNTPPPSHAAQAAAQAQQQQIQQQQAQQRLPPMLPPHHYSHPSLSPLMAARSADPSQQQYRQGGGVTEIGALLNGGPSNGEQQSGSASAHGSPQQTHQQPSTQQQHQAPTHGVKRSGSPLEHTHTPQPSEGQVQQSPHVSAGSIPNSPRNERREVPAGAAGTYRASN
ncbi:hypothetical protein C8Q74DRAFT_1365268 [Fomes fomentarius]|nr:hypothetical protein C8Q74DRAFT_1365268 [Fomes fomentarius]